MSDLKTYIDNKLSDMKISDELAEKIFQDTMGDNGASGRKQKKSAGVFVKMAIGAAVFCLVLTCSVTALATSVPAVNDFIYRFSPQFAQVLYPIQKSKVDQGIKLEVLYAANDNHNVVVYFSIQDTEGKGRVSDNLDLCDSEYVDGPNIFGTKLIDYDEATETAYYQMEATGGTNLSNRMVTFRFSSLMSNKETYDWYDTNIDIPSYFTEEPEVIVLSEEDFFGRSTSFEEEEEESNKVLKPDVMNISLGGDIDFVTISNIGFVDGKLHIQTRWEKSFDNHGELWLVDENGVNAEEEANMVSYETYYFQTDEEKEGDNVQAAFHWESGKHIEYVYDIASVEELAGYNLWGWFVKDGTFTDGNWKVNFRTSDVSKDSLVITDLDEIAGSVEVTPLGIYVEDYQNNVETAELLITLKNGSSLEYSNFSSTTYANGKSNLFTQFDQTIDTREIEGIWVNQVKIY